MRALLARATASRPTTDDETNRKAEEEEGIAGLTASAPTSLFELRRGLAVALRAEADKATASPPKLRAKAEVLRHRRGVTASTVCGRLVLTDELRPGINEIVVHGSADEAQDATEAAALPLQVPVH